MAWYEDFYLEQRQRKLTRVRISYDWRMQPQFEGVVISTDHKVRAISSNVCIVSINQSREQDALFRSYNDVFKMASQYNINIVN
jgi:hypothetical protein